MTLIEILQPWFKEKFPGGFRIENTPQQGVFLVGAKTGWIAKIYDNSVEVRSTGSPYCVCCALRKTLRASDPEFFQQFEDAIRLLLDYERTHLYEVGL